MQRILKVLQRLQKAGTTSLIIRLAVYHSTPCCLPLISWPSQSVWSSSPSSVVLNYKVVLRNLAPSCQLRPTERRRTTLVYYSKDLVKADAQCKV